MSFGTANFLPRYTTQNKYGVIETFSWVTGAHSIKFGVDFKFERATNLATSLFAGQYTFNSYADFANAKPASYAQAFPAPGTAGGLTYPNLNFYALFAQDSWRATDRLTINYGIRYDIFAYDGNAVRNPDPGLAALHLQTGVVPTDFGNAAGRLGLAYRLDTRGHFVVRAAVGTFYGSLPGLLPRTIQAQNGIQVQSYSLTGASMPAYPSTLSTAPSIAGAAPDIYVMQPGFKTPRTQQWNANLQAQLAQLCVDDRLPWRSGNPTDPGAGLESLPGATCIGDVCERHARDFLPASGRERSGKAGCGLWAYQPGRERRRFHLPRRIRPDREAVRQWVAVSWQLHVLESN
jgi:hypothetical protein